MTGTRSTLHYVKRVTTIIYCFENVPSVVTTQSFESIKSSRTVVAGLFAGLLLTVTETVDPTRKVEVVEMPKDAPKCRFIKNC